MKARRPEPSPAPSAPGLRLPVLSLLLLVAWTVHWHTLSRLELGLDGALSVDLARSPLGDMFAFCARDVHPPFFYALLKYWLDLSGAHYYTAKYLAIAGSLPALALLDQFARRLLPPWPALIAVFLLAVAPTTLLLSPTVRDFSLGLTLSLATLVLTLDLSLNRALTTRRYASLLCALAVLTAAALLTWYFHLFVLAAEALIVLRPHRRLGGIGTAFGAGCLAASPWYLYVLPHVTGKLTHGTTTFGSAPRLPTGLQLVDGALQALFGQPVAAATVAAGIAWVVLLTLGVRVIALGQRNRPELSTGPSTAAHRSRASTLLLGVALALGMLEVGLTTLRWSDIGSLSRYVLPLLPFTAILQAAAFVAQGRWWRRLALAGLVVIVPAQLSWFVGLVGSTPIDWAHDPALAYVATHAHTGDAIVFNDRARRARYVLDGGTLPAAVVHSAGQAYLADSQAQADSTAAQLVLAATRIWLVQVAPSVDVAQRSLVAHAFGLPPTDVSGSVVQLFLTHVDAPRRPVGLTLGGVITLAAARLPASAAIGGPLPVELDWQSDKVESVAYTVFVHLKPAPDKTAAQYDSPPQDGYSPTTTWRPGQNVSDRFAIPLALSLPPGAYSIHIGLYAGATRLTLPSGVNYIDLGTIHLEPPLTSRGD